MHPYLAFCASTMSLECSRVWRCICAATTRSSPSHSGQSALQLLKEKGPPAVIVSDMRMPAMNGAVLLKQVKNLYPDTVCILLTGEPGRDPGHRGSQ
jgi:CheY-like chemotaxis protein